MIRGWTKPRGGSLRRTELTKIEKVSVECGSVNMDPLEDRLRTYSAYFTTMVDLIPAKFYLTKDPEMDESLQSSKYWVNKKSKAPKQSVKEATKRARRMKLDPDNQKTNIEQQRDALDLEAKSSAQVECEDFNEGLVNPQKKGFSVETVRSTELSDLRERLKAKVDSLRGKRKVREVEPEQKALKKQKVMEKRKRRKEARQNKKRHQQNVAATKAGKERPSIKEESGKIVFSKFDFSVPSKQANGTKHKNDYRRLLAKAEATEKKLEELKRNDKKRGEELQERLEWRKAMDLAKGEKVKDNPKLIKKTLKRLEKKKSQSHKQWMERASQEQQQREKRQELRRKHIQERVEHIKAKKSKKRFKKGKRTPGF